MKWNIFLLIFVIIGLSFPMVVNNSSAYIESVNADTYFEDFQSFPIGRDSDDFINNSWFSIETGPTVHNGKVFIDQVSNDGYIDRFLRLEGASNTMWTGEFWYDTTDYLTHFSAELNFSSRGLNDEFIFYFANVSSVQADEGTFRIGMRWQNNDLLTFVEIGVGDRRYLKNFSWYDYTTGTHNSTITLGFEIYSIYDMKAFVYTKDSYGSYDFDVSNLGWANATIISQMRLDRFILFNVEGNVSFLNVNIKTADDFVYNSYFDQYGQLKPMGTMFYTGAGDGNMNVVPDHTELAYKLVYDTDKVKGTTHKVNGFWQDWYVGTNWEGELESFNVYCIAEHSTTHTSNILPLFSAKLATSFAGLQMEQHGSPVVLPTGKRWRNPNDITKWLTVYKLSWFNLDKGYDNNLFSILDFRVHFTLFSPSFHVWVGLHKTTKDWNDDSKTDNQGVSLEWYNFPEGYHKVQSFHDTIHWIGYDLDDGGGTGSDNSYSLIYMDRNVKCGDTFEIRIAVTGDNSIKTWMEIVGLRDFFARTTPGGQDGFTITDYIDIPAYWGNRVCYYHIVDEYMSHNPSKRKSFRFNTTTNSDNWGIKASPSVAEFGETIDVYVKANAGNIYKVNREWMDGGTKDDIFTTKTFQGTGNWRKVHSVVNNHVFGSWVFTLLNVTVPYNNRYDHPGRVINSSTVYCIGSGSGGTNDDDFGKGGSTDNLASGRVFYGNSVVYYEILHGTFMKYHIHMQYTSNHENLTLRLSNKHTSATKVYSLVEGTTGELFYNTNNKDGWNLQLYIKNEPLNGSGEANIDIDDKTYDYDSDTEGSYNEGAFTNLAGIGVIIGFIVVPLGLFRDNAFMMSQIGTIAPIFGFLGLAVSVLFGLLFVWVAFVFGFLLILILIWMILQRV